MSHKPDLLKDDIYKIFIRYLVPGIAAMMALSLYVLFDTIFVGRGIGSDGLTALNIAIPLYNVLGAIGLLLGVGGATAAAISMGKDDYKKVNEIFSLSVITAAIISILFTVFGLAFLDRLCYLLGANEESFPMVKEYLRVLILFSTTFIMSNTLSVFIRNDRAPRLSMLSTIVGSLTNIVLDYVFIFIFGWGMTGAVVATVIGSTLGFLLLLTHFRKGNTSLKLRFIKLQTGTLGRIIRNGSPSFIVEISSGIVIIAFNLVLGRLIGNIGISAYSIIANISLMGAAVFIGVAHASQPIISINYGADKVERVFKIRKLAMITTAILGAIFYLIGLLFPEFIIRQFNRDNLELMKITAGGIKIYFTAFIFMGLNIVMGTYFQSIEYSFYSMIISVLRGVALVLLGLLILSTILGVNGVWLSVPFAEIITLVAAFMLVKKKSIAK